MSGTVKCLYAQYQMSCWIDKKASILLQLYYCLDWYGQSKDFCGGPKKNNRKQKQKQKTHTHTHPKKKRKANMINLDCDGSICA